MFPGTKGNTAAAAAGFIGSSDFALKQLQQATPVNLQGWFWNWAFCSASTTILSGSIAERATFR